jgi:ABC-type sugar transport system ATPase subunit
MSVSAPPAIRFEEIGKGFPGVIALDGVTVEIAEGSCHALCGENGAGKSTLAKLLAGIYAPDAGRIFLFGDELTDFSPRAARDAGVGIVHQELQFCDNLSVAENLCLAELPTRYGLFARREMEERAAAMLARVGGKVDVRRVLGELSIWEQQIIQIAAAVAWGARVIVFDEPTSSLSQPEAERLYDLIRALKADGMTCIYVSHRMPEIFALCDTVTVLRDGRHVGTVPIEAITESELVGMMIGRPLHEYLPDHANAPRTDEVLRVEGLSAPGEFAEISFALHSGEVLGLAGLIGAGRSDVAEALFGLGEEVTGRIFVDGKEVGISSPQDAIQLGMGLVPEDRKKQGLVLSLSGLHNSSLPILQRLSRLKWIQKRRERTLAEEYFERLRVRVTAMDEPVAGLSGGNQQKIVLAKWLSANCRVLILDEPTRGVDVGAKAEIHTLIDRLASQGTAVLLISSELPELLALSSRILVLRGGRIVGEVSRAEATQERVLRMMAGLEAVAAA